MCAEAKQWDHCSVVSGAGDVVTVPFSRAMCSPNEEIVVNVVKTEIAAQENLTESLNQE